MNTEKEKKYILNGLDCPVCAEKIEAKARSLAGVINAEVSFATKQLTVKYSDEYQADDTEKSLINLIKKIEPDVEISLNGIKSDLAEDIEKRIILTEIFRICAAIILFTAGLIFSGAVSVILFLAACVTVGYDVIFAAVRNTFRGEFFDENTLMTIAVSGAVIIGEYPEAAAVMLFYHIGEFFQKLSVNKSRKSITNLMNIRPDYANVKRNGAITRVNPREAAIGETIVVKAGERVPIDGTVIAGTSDIDMSAISGESAPKAVRTGDEVFSGAVNLSGVLEIKTTKEYSQSTASKILELVENAASRKSKTEKFITKFSKVYTPIVVLAAVVVGLAVPLMFGFDLKEWVYKGLVFLIVSCPCALVLSVPLSYFCGIGRASAEGILVKGSNCFESLGNVKTVVFDKTGTLTSGRLSVGEIRAAGISESEFVKLLAHAEFYSVHPLAKAVTDSYGKLVDESIISDYTETAGEGVCVSISGKRVLAGNSRLLSRYGIEYPKIAETLIYVAVDGEYKGAAIFTDEVKETSMEAVKTLSEQGIKVIMLTGDNSAKAETVAKKLGITEYRAELLPQDKGEQVDLLKSGLQKNETLIFVGDGINDAPVLALADTGIAMGGFGSDSAIEAADAVIMNDEPIKVCAAIDIARRTKIKAQQNIALAIGVKLAVQILSILGFADMWAAVCADVGVTLLAVINAMRLTRQP